MISKFNNFIIESIINDIILEAVVFKSDFSYTLRDISREAINGEDKIANILLSSMGKDINITQNYIGLSDEVDKITFLPENKVKLDKVKIIKEKVIDADRPNVHKIILDAGIPLNGELVQIQPSRFSENNIVNDWKLVKMYNMNDLPGNWNDYVLYHLQNNIDTSKYTVVYNHLSNDPDEPIESIVPITGIGKLKIGRYINRLLDLRLNKEDRKEYTASDVEKFVNLFISKMEFNKNALNNFDLVNAEDIKKWYSGDVYSNKTGQLGQSCMQYDKCQSYFRIYIENPDVCQLLIFKDTTGNKILGRALLWKTDNGNCMDRVYTTKDSLIPLFNKWAEVNNYENCYKSDTQYKVKVNPIDYEQYPYMDSFRFYIKDEGILTNIEPNGHYWNLTSTSGGYSY